MRVPRGPHRHLGALLFMKTLAEHADDILFAVGILLIGAGVAFIYWPAALVVVGVILMVAGAGAAYRKAQ